MPELHDTPASVPVTGAEALLAQAIRVWGTPTPTPAQIEAGFNYQTRAGYRNVKVDRPSVMKMVMGPILPTGLVTSAPAPNIAVQTVSPFVPQVVFIVGNLLIGNYIRTYYGSIGERVRCEFQDILWNVASTVSTTLRVYTMPLDPLNTTANAALVNYCAWIIQNAAVVLREGSTSAQSRNTFGHLIFEAMAYSGAGDVLLGFAAKMKWVLGWKEDQPYVFVDGDRLMPGSYYIPDFFQYVIETSDELVLNKRTSL